MRPRAHELFTERRARDLYPAPRAGVVEMSPALKVMDKEPKEQGPLPLTNVYRSARQHLLETIARGSTHISNFYEGGALTCPAWGRICPAWGRICHTLWPPYDDVLPPGCYPKVLRWERPILESRELRIVQAYAREFVDTVRVSREEHQAHPERIEQDVCFSLLGTDISNPDTLVAEALLSARRGAIQNGCSPERVLTHHFKEGLVQFILPRILDGVIRETICDDRARIVFLDELDELAAPGEPPFWFAQSLADGPSALAYFIAKLSQLISLEHPAEEDDPWRYWGYFKAETVVLADAHKLVWGVAQ